MTLCNNKRDAALLEPVIPQIHFKHITVFLSLVLAKAVSDAAPGEPGTLQPKLSSRSSPSPRPKMARTFAMNSSRPSSPDLAAHPLVSSALLSGACVLLTPSHCHAHDGVQAIFWAVRAQICAGRSSRAVGGSLVAGKLLSALHDCPK